MGLFSFLGKNKQDRTAQESGRFSGGVDDAFVERARSKRASHAGGATRGGRGADDPVLPEKKRARRRLVGAIALALAAAVGLPMLLDSQPKPLAGDIAIEIPAKDKVAPMPMPADPQAPQTVSAVDSVDKGEQIVEPPRAAAPAQPEPRTVREVQPAAAPQQPPASGPVHATIHPEPDIAAPKPEHRKAEPKPAERPAEKPVKKAEDKPAHAASADAARALAILQGKPADKAADGEKVTIQVAALGSQEKAAELVARLRGAGIHAFTEKVQHAGGTLVRVKVGPYSKDEADKVRAKLAKLM